jgi:hypothetical protein
MVVSFFRYLGLGFLGYRLYSLYAKKAANAMDWTYEIDAVGLTRYSTKNIEGYVDWQFINASELVGQVKDIDVDFLYKGNNIGSISMPGPYLVPAKGSADVRTNFKLDLEQVYSKALMAISELAQYGDITIQVKGSIKVRTGQLLYVKLPISVNTTAKTLYSYIS